MTQTAAARPAAGAGPERAMAMPAASGPRKVPNASPSALVTFADTSSSGVRATAGRMAIMVGRTRAAAPDPSASATNTRTGTSTMIANATALAARERTRLTQTSTRSARAKRPGSRNRLMSVAGTIRTSDTNPTSAAPPTS